MDKSTAAGSGMTQAGPVRLAGTCVLLSAVLLSQSSCTRVSASPVSPIVSEAVHATGVSFSLPPAGTGTPFGASTKNLKASGYSEQEYFVSGTASRYRITDPLTTAERVDSGHPYTTRILVRRPINPSQFNGVVLVEWLNVSAQQDFDWVFGPMREHLLKNGYAWVGVSAQTVGANRLRAKNLARYQAIKLDASNVDPKGGFLDKGIQGVGGANTSGGDVLSWDIFAQVGAAMRKRGSLDPLGGLKPRLVIAAGESQSAFRLSDYHNAIHPFYPKVYDGFFAYDRITKVRTDLPTKVWGLASEAMAEYMGPATPDAKNLRIWEVAGGSHVDLHDVDDYADEQVVANGVWPLPPPWNARSMREAYGTCPVMPVLSRVRNADVLDAGLESLVTWIKTGKAPPSAPRLAADANGKILKDKDGLVIGGVRLAAYDAPMSDSQGRNPGPSFCYLVGSHVDFTPAQMCQRYGSPANYVARVIAVTRRNQRQGFLLKDDAARTIADAKKVKFNCQG